MKKLTTLFGALTLILLTSCGNYNRISYQKSLRSSSTVKTTQKAEKSVSTRQIEETADLEPEETFVLASTNAEDDLNFLIEKEEASLIEEIVADDTIDTQCDELVLRNGEDLQVKVQLVTETSVRYKNCDHLDGPDYEKPINDLLYVKYANGRKEIFKTEEKKPEEVKVPARKRNSSGENMTITGFVLGAASVFLFITGIIPILALTFSWTGIIRGRHEGEISRYEGLGIVGVILGAAGIIAAGILYLFLLY